MRGVKDVFLGTVAMTRRMLGVSKPGDERNQDRMRRAWVTPERLEWLVIDEADVLLGELGIPMILVKLILILSQAKTSKKRPWRSLDT